MTRGPVRHVRAGLYLCAVIEALQYSCIIETAANGYREGHGMQQSPAKEYFEAARSAQRSIDAHINMIASLRAREGARTQRYDRIGGVSKGGKPDGMAATDARMAAEDGAESELRYLYGQVEDARGVCRGVRAANPCHRVWGDVLELRYCEDMCWTAVANSVLASERQCRTWHDQALDWVDGVGIARARTGAGQAALF